jgi:hypothetical protein
MKVEHSYFHPPPAFIHFKHLACQLPAIRLVRLDGRTGRIKIWEVTLELQNDAAHSRFNDIALLNQRCGSPKSGTLTPMIGRPGI